MWGFILGGVSLCVCGVIFGVVFNREFILLGGDDPSRRFLLGEVLPKGPVLGGILSSIPS